MRGIHQCKYDLVNFLCKGKLKDDVLDGTPRTHLK